MEENTPRRKVTIDLVKANIFSIVLMVGTAIALLVPYYLIWHPTTSLLGHGATPLEWLAILAVMLAGIIAHELIHGLTWSCYAPSGWQSIRFGVIWKMLTPYCHCNEPLPKRAYMLGAMMPCLVLGLAPALTALAIGCLPLLLWGIFFIAAASGDIWMTWLLTKERPDSLILDHPSEAGFYVIEATA